MERVVIPPLPKCNIMSSASRSKKVPSPINGYNPALGKFHIVDRSPPSSIHINSRFSSIEETNDPSVKDYDTISNNSSWSGDSEDHKEKTAPHIPSLQTDNEKREKIRQKNEKKHQRQKERRAQELHDRCIGFLMSRKLEAFSQQLVVMGFSAEGATMALILKQGKIEESISWLIEEGDCPDKHKQRNLRLDDLKIDVSEELSRIADMEIRYKCSKQDVERAIVFCEGDIEKAEKSMTTQMKPSVTTSLEEYKGGDNDFICQKTDVATATHQEIKKSLPKLDSPLLLQRTSPQPKSEAHNVLLEKGIKNEQLVKQDQVVLMQRPRRDDPKLTPPMGNVINTDQIYSEEQHHRKIGVKRGKSPTISVASSLGLYSGLGSTTGSYGPSSHADWNSVGPWLMQFDYTNVDWTLNPSPPRSNSTGMWQEIASSVQTDRRSYDPFSSGSNARNWSFREWSSPFEERDIFSLPRQFVYPPPSH